MKKQFYDIKGKIKFVESTGSELEKIETEIQKQRGKISDRSTESFHFSSDLSELSKMLPVIQPNSPGPLVAVSQGIISAKERPDGLLIEYRLSLNRIRNICIMICLISFISFALFVKFLALVVILLTFFLAWCWIYPMAFISVRDTFESLVKKTISQ